jgi:outer membrane protein OmpA-like peptidoglycan-associated protein/tetratricopeptide (TPR) repeat protein
MTKRIAILVFTIFAYSIHAQTKTGSIKKAENDAVKNDYAASAEQYEQVLRKDSNNYKANFEYGVLQVKYLNNPAQGGKYLLRAERLSKKDTASQIIYGLAEYYQYQGQYIKAISYYKRALTYLEDDEDGITLKTRINQSIADCEYAQKNPMPENRKNIRIVNVGGGINTIYPEYVPVVNKDESIMMFTSRRNDFSHTGIDNKDGRYFEDMFISRKDKDGVFRDAHPFAPTDKDVKDITNTTKDHESVVSISYSGDKFYTYRKNKIYSSDLQKNVWSAPKQLDTNINADVFQNHICVTNDGKTIYFSSERKNGIGGLDLYKTEKKSDGTWTQAVSLGDVINTKEDDGSPFITEDGKTLYFASKGHNGFGGYDLYKSTYNGSTWSEPQNMGIPFNSAGDDIYMVINKSEKHGYLSSSRAGGYGDMDIYAINYLRPPFENFYPDSLNRITFTAPDTAYVGQVINFTAKSTQIPLTEFKKINWAVGDSILDSTATTLVNYTFNKSGTYKVKVEAQGLTGDFYGYEKSIVIIEKPINIATNTFGLEPLYFEFNKSNIDEAGLQALIRNIKTLNAHPEALIEIGTYCDSRGSASYNQALSERRAKAVIKELKKQGFDTKRVKQVDWFGEKNPVNKCSDTFPCTEDEYKLNRRAEFRLIK